MSNSLHAVLNPRQLDNFCKLFNLKEGDIEANFNGWHKLVLMTKDTVFMFPRSPEYADAVSKEPTLYEEFAHVQSVALPRLVKRVHDKEISYYEFGAITRLRGVAFSSVIDDLSTDQLKPFLVELARITADWHSIPLAKLPSILTRTIDDGGPVTLENWGVKALTSASSSLAVDFMYSLVVSQVTKPDSILLDETQVKVLWCGALSELAALDHVLVHADIHEDQLLVDPHTRGIAAVLDWESARIDNPVWDFDFGEWGLEIWKWTDDFAAMRQAIWSTYCTSRGLAIRPHGLHLFYTLCEITRNEMQKDKSVLPMTSRGYVDSVALYLTKLEEIQKSLS